jgi:hypothetical protein
MHAVADALLFLGTVLVVWTVVVWIGGACMAGWVAAEKGRDPAAWVILAFVLSPPLALVALAAAPAVVEPDEEPALEPAVAGRHPALQPVLGRIARA